MPTRRSCAENTCQHDAPARRTLANTTLLRGESGAEFLSLDVQGAEELVLRAVDPAAFKVIMVEMDGFDKAKESRIHSLILNAGLKQANTSFRVPYKRVYTARSLS